MLKEERGPMYCEQGHDGQVEALLWGCWRGKEELELFCFRCFHAASVEGRLGPCAPLSMKEARYATWVGMITKREVREASGAVKSLEA